MQQYICYFISFSQANLIYTVNDLKKKDVKHKIQMVITLNQKSSTREDVSASGRETMHCYEAPERPERPRPALALCADCVLMIMFTY